MAAADLSAGLPRAPLEGVAGGIAYGEWPGAGRPIVLLHGITSNYLHFLHLAPLLAGDHHVVALDLRGRGRSTGDGPFGLAAHAADAAAVADALGLEAPVLAGHSLGAYAASAAVASQPGRWSALGLIDGGVWLPEPVPLETLRALFAGSSERLGRRFASLPHYEADRQGDGPPLTRERRAVLARDLGGGPGAYVPRLSPAGFEADLADAGGHSQGNALLDGIELPVLVVRARLGVTGDPLTAIVPDAALADARGRLRDLRVVDLPEACHGAVVDPPHVAAVAAALLELAR